MGLPRNHRLRKRECAALFANGRLLHHALFTVRVARIDQQGAFAFSVVVPKKIAHNAVERNRLKRRVYGALKEVLPYIPHSLQGMIILKKAAIHERAPSIQDALKSVLTNA